MVNTGAIAGNLTQGAGIYLEAGGVVTNNLGGTITGLDGIYAGSATATVVNAGSISGGNSAVGGFGINLAAGGMITNEAGGVIYGFDDGVQVSGADATVINLGQITGINHDYQFPDGDAGVSLVTGGILINGQAGGSASTATISGYFYGVQFSSKKISTLTNYGTVTDLFGGKAIGMENGLIVNGPSGATAALIDAGGGDAVSFSGAGTVINYATISAFGGSGYYGVLVTGAGSISNAGTAALIQGYGGVYLMADGTVTNAGTIESSDGTNGVAVRFAGTTNRLIVDPGAVFIGSVSATGTATLELASTSASGTGTLSGLGTQFVNFSQVTVDACAYWTFGGTNSLAAGATLTNSGTLTDTGTLLNAGTLTGNVLRLSGASLTNQSGGVMSATYVYGLAAGGTDTVLNQGTINGSAQAAIYLAAAGYVSNASSGVISGYATGVKLAGANATLSNAGQIVTTATSTITYGAILASGGLVTNTTLGTIIGGYGGVVGSASGIASVANAGTISGLAGFGVYLHGTGNVGNAGSGLISAYTLGVKLKGTNATLSNLGRIIAAAVDPAGYGAYLRNGGMVTNGQAGAGTSTASIVGYTGLVFKSVDDGNVYGTLVNYGTVIGTGVETPGVLLNNTGTISNGRSGATGALIEGGHYGVSSVQGPVVNYATIIGRGTAGDDYGVAIWGTGSVGNLGTAALIEGYGGVLIETDGTVTNAGTIESNQGTSGIAIHFTDGDARLIDDPGAVFIGSVYGGSGGTAVLQLASGSSAGTISGLGTTVTNFTSLVFDAGAQWTVAGNDAPGGLGTLGISGFTAGDTIDLTNFSAFNRTFAANTLTLVDGAGDYETLHIQGNFSTSNFRITDVAGDTEVTFLNPPVVTAGGTVTFTGGGAPVTLDAGLGIADTASTTLVSAMISFGSGFIAGDTLNFTALNAITGSFSSTTGTLTLSGADTLADYQAALEFDHLQRQPEQRRSDGRCR